MSHRDVALEVLAKVSGIDRDLITPDMDLVANLGLDSAKALELLVALEDRLGLEIEEDEAAGLNTVGDIFAFLDRVVPQSAGSA